jgi:hypothetical protein
VNTYLVRRGSNSNSQKLTQFAAPTIKQTFQNDRALQAVWLPGLRMRPDSGLLFAHLKRGNFAQIRGTPAPKKRDQLGVGQPVLGVGTATTPQKADR